MNELLDSLLYLLSVLLMDGITVKELKMLFRTALDISHSPRKASHSHKLLGVAHRLLQYHRGPSQYFEFNSVRNESGLVLPPIKSWPGYGYSFCAWVWLDPFGENTHKPLNVVPFVFSFCGDKDNGIELFFQNDAALVLKVTVGRLAQQIEVTLGPELKFQPRTWYFIAFAHTPYFMRTGEVSVYINGTKALVTPLLYPRFDEQLSICTVGTKVPRLAHSPSKTKAKTDPLSCQLHGRISPFLFFESPLTDEQIGSLYSSHFHRNFLTQLNDELASKLFMAYSPQARFGRDMYLEQSMSSRVFENEQNYYKEKDWHDKQRLLQLSKSAKALAGTIPAMNGMPIKRAYATMTQNSWVFFIIILLRRLCSRRNTVSDSIWKVECLAEGLKMLTTLIKEDEAVMHDMYEGLILMGRVLFEKYAPPILWDLQENSCVDALFQLGAAVATEESLWPQMLTHVYLNFDIWNYCDSATQNKIVDMLTDLINASPELFRKLLGVQGVMDILRKYYWITAPPLSAEPQSESNRMRAAQEVKSRTLSTAQVYELRRKILHWAEILIVTEPSAEEIARLAEKSTTNEQNEGSQNKLQFEYDSEPHINLVQRDLAAIHLYLQQMGQHDSLQIEDTLKLVCSLLARDLEAYSVNTHSSALVNEEWIRRKKIFFGEHILKLAGSMDIYAFVGLLRTATDEATRLWILRTIAKLVECRENQKQKASFDALAPAALHRLVVNPKLLASIKLHLQACTVTIETYKALMALVLGNDIHEFSNFTAPPVVLRPVSEVQSLLLRPFEVKEEEDHARAQKNKNKYVDDLEPPPSPRNSLASSSDGIINGSMSVLASRAPPPASTRYLGKGKIKYQGFIPIIFELVFQSKDTELQTLLMSDFLRLLQHSYTNREVFLQLNFSEDSGRAPPTSTAATTSWQWKVWLFGLLANNSKDPLFSSLVIDFFVVLLHHAMTPAKTANPLSINSFLAQRVTSSDSLHVDRDATQSINEAEEASLGESVDEEDHVEIEASLALRNLIETHALIKYFGARGYFDTLTFSQELHKRLFLPVARSIKTCPPPMVSGDPQSRPSAYTTSSWDLLIKKIENWLSWMETIEEYLFYFNPVNQVSTETDPFLASMHRTQSGQWADLTFSTDVLDALDLLNNKLKAWKGSLPSSHYLSKPFVALQHKLYAINERLSLRIALTTLHEVDAYIVTDAENPVVGGLENMERLVIEDIASAPVLPTQSQHEILTATSDYLAQKKNAFWQRSNRGQKVYERCIQIIASRFLSASSELTEDAVTQAIFKRYFVIGFLYKAMKRSHETSGGASANAVLEMYTDLLKDLKRRCSEMSPECLASAESGDVVYLLTESQRVLKSIPDEELLAYFFSGFTNTSKGFSLIQPVGEAIKREHQVVQLLASRFDMYSTKERDRILRAMHSKMNDELDLQNAFAEQFGIAHSSWVNVEETRLSTITPPVDLEWLEQKWATIWTVATNSTAPCYMPNSSQSLMESIDIFFEAQNPATPPLTQSNAAFKGPAAGIDKPSANIKWFNQNTEAAFYPTAEGAATISIEIPDDEAVYTPRALIESSHPQQTQPLATEFDDLRDSDERGIKRMLLWRERGTVVLVHNNGTISTHCYQPQSKTAQTRSTINCSLEADRQRANSYTDYFPNILVANLMNSSSNPAPLSFVDPRNVYALCPSRTDGSTAFLIHGGQPDARLCVTRINEAGGSGARGTCAPMVPTPHSDVITAVALSADCSTLVTASRDSTVVLWTVEESDTRPGLLSALLTGARIEPPKLSVTHVLAGHDSEIVAVDVDTHGDLCVATSSDGTSLVYNCKEGKFMYTLDYTRDNYCGDESDAAVRVLSMVRVLRYTRRVVSYCTQQRILYVHSIDDRNGGKLLAWHPVETDGTATCWTLCANERYLVIGTSTGELQVWSLGGGEDSSPLRCEYRSSTSAGSGGGGGSNVPVSCCVVLEAGTDYAKQQRDVLAVGLQSGVVRLFPIM
eukprot:TRINITY_DN1838_c0_g1_i1.p1 TRINITY_DN1838_c0_g1~~TRINITY_DN1838_c0_g1_i1.p1  ORF type:complete len:2139 (-),score=297.64 TRINITY_DN1838_c0_g1_i1:48-5999(-)